MNKELFQNVEGINVLYDSIADFTWSSFYHILEFRWYRKFDNEEWYDRSYFEMKMASEDEKNIALFKFKDAEFVGSLSIDGYISGFDIINKTIDYQKSTYEIIDFEDNAIHMLCSDFSVKLLQVNGGKK